MSQTNFAKSTFRQQEKDFSNKILSIEHNGNNFLRQSQTKLSQPSIVAIKNYDLKGDNSDLLGDLKIARIGTLNMLSEET